MSINKNITEIKKRIANAAKKSGRAKEDICLMAVTKYAEISQIEQAAVFGIKIIGENMVNSAEEKFSMIRNINLKKHMIGHLQTNKAKKAVDIFDSIDSVDSLRLAGEINKHAKNAVKIMQVMIQVNISGETQKYGIKPEETTEFYKELLNLKNLKITGIMAIAPYVPAQKARPYFRRMKKIFDNLNLKWLSMGMTNDFEIAIEEGANMVRIGTAIFK